MTTMYRIALLQAMAALLVESARAPSAHVITARGVEEPLATFRDTDRLSDPWRRRNRSHHRKARR
jgi:hypothetical protein